MTKAKLAVIGNPNAGKTSVFNALTGSQQKVGNYAGVTVERVTGRLQVEQFDIQCLDIPGVYSLQAVSEDEKVAVDSIRGDFDGPPDLAICVMDATNLERNLYLFSQVAELGYPVLVALTMVDRLPSLGLELDLARLSNLLGVEVITVAAHRDARLDSLRTAIARNLEMPRVPLLRLGSMDPATVQASALREKLARVGADVSQAEVMRALLEDQGALPEFLSEFPEFSQDFQHAKDSLAPATESPSSTVSDRYEWATVVQRAVIGSVESAVSKRTVTDRIDLVLTHRVFGLIIFAAVMYLVFQCIYTFAQPLMDGIDKGFTWLGELVRPLLLKSPILESLVVDGIIKGVGGMLVFLPQIAILFFFIAVLEGTGYLARAAFLMDRLLGWCGLNGRAFIPLLSSFACAIPGIMAARVMPDPKSRLATILVAPLMSCSARLPVYLLLIGAFIQPKFGAFWAGFALFAMHLLGLVVAIPVAWFLNRNIIRGKRLPFLLELPPYQWPRWRDVWLAISFRARVFIKTAGTMIVFMSMLIWALCYFPQMPLQDSAATKTKQVQQLQEEQLAQSYLGRFGKMIEPAFIPAGFDWRITTSILAAFPARETVVPSLGIIFSLGADVDEQDQGLQKSLSQATWPDGRPLMTDWTAVGLMVFFALCAQCMATLATVKRETNSWKWPVFMFTYMTTLAYLAAVGIHQLARYLGKA